MTASNTEIVPTTTIVDKPTPITPPFTPTQPITVISTTVYSSTETFHIGDQNIEGFEPLISLCHEILFQVALPVNEFYLELETYGTEAQNPIIVNKSEIAILSPQGIRSPNEWTGTRTVQLPANSLVEGMNILGSLGISVKSPHMGVRQKACSLPGRDKCAERDASDWLCHRSVA